MAKVFVGIWLVQEYLHADQNLQGYRSTGATLLLGWDQVSIDNMGADLPHIFNRVYGYGDRKSCKSLRLGRPLYVQHCFECLCISRHFFPVKWMPGGLPVTERTGKNKVPEFATLLSSPVPKVSKSQHCGTSRNFNKKIL